MAGQIETPEQQVARLIGELSAERVSNRSLTQRLEAELKMRPHWALGYNDASVAAQANATALNQLWTLLGVNNQTSAVTALQALTGAGSSGP